MKQLKITSSDNEKIKLLKKLKQKKYRDEHSLFFVENFNIINDALSAGVSFDSIYVTDEFINKYNMQFNLLLHASGIDAYFLITGDVNRIFSELSTPSGICAIYSKKEKQINTEETVIYLNGINDPGNLGAILRSAAAFGLDNILIDEHCADLYNSKTVNSAKDAIFKLNICFDKNLELLKAVKNKMKIFSTAVKAEGSKNIDIVSDEKKSCIVLGSEAKGVDKDIQSLSDEFISIETTNKMESLNVASAAAIIFYSVYKRKNAV